MNWACNMQALCFITAQYFVGEKHGLKGPFAASMNSYFSMPFGDGARIQLINESKKRIVLNIDNSSNQASI